MSYRFPICLIAGSLAVLVVCASYGTEQHYSPQELAAAKAKLREHNQLWTFEAGAILAREWLNRVPEDAELRALYARQLHGQIYGPKEIQEQADAILEREPDNPWGLYAQALAFLADWNYSEAVEPSLRAWKLLPHPEFAATHLQALKSKSVEEGLAFLDSVDEATLQHPEVLHARAQFEARRARENPAYVDTSLATLAMLRERWPDHVSGYRRAAEYLYQEKPQEALALIETAVRLAPGSADVRYWHWQILNETDLLPVEERRPAIEAGIAEYRQAVPEALHGLTMLASVYSYFLADEEKAAEFEAKLVALAPESKQASWAYQREYKRIESELESERDRIEREHGADSQEYQNQLRLVRDAAYRFLEKPLYNDSFGRERAYLNLFEALEAIKPIPAEELANAVREMVQYEQLSPHFKYSIAPISMANHTPYAEEAAELARGGILAIRDKAEEEGWEESRLNYYLTDVHDAIGWASYKAGRIQEGRNELERALELSGTNTSAHYHLGQVFGHMATEAEAQDAAETFRDWLDKAEESYIAGLDALSWGQHPCQEALEALYERRHGSREGLDEYLAAFIERERLQRRQRILESRLDTARTYEPFALTKLDGERVDSADFDGKIAVLHFWSTTCAPCVWEMPEYQKFHARYLNDPEVEVISISRDKSRDVVDKYMAKNEYDFTVLMDDGYMQKASIYGVPRTWFVDGDGYIQFVQRGGSSDSHLEEEFAWIVEALRGAEESP
ncbi:MAG: TlpA disulfide reductase family protein [Gemmatimonadetes bacterium]|nr:TlpA disulfide reductase family protein [Gemmatimonadota bacterium]